MGFIKVYDQLGSSSIQGVKDTDDEANITTYSRQNKSMAG